MSPKEKAEELVMSFFRIQDESNETTWIQAKQCALIAVDEVLGYMGADRGTEFWLEVKIEIEKL